MCVGGCICGMSLYASVCVVCAHVSLCAYECLCVGCVCVGVCALTRSDREHHCTPGNCPENSQLRCLTFPARHLQVQKHIKHNHELTHHMCISLPLTHTHTHTPQSICASLFLSLSLTHTHTHTHHNLYVHLSFSHTHTHTRMHADTHSRHGHLGQPHYR